MVSSALYVAENGRLFVAFWAPHLHDACGAPRVAGRRESPGRAGARRPYQSRHDATLHRGRYRGQAQARRARVRRGSLAPRVQKRTRDEAPPHTSRLTLHARAGAQAAWQRRTACTHACCCTCRKDGVKPSDAGRCTGYGTRGACPCQAPQRSSPVLSSRLTRALRVSIGAGGGRPTTVRQTGATRTPLIARAEMWVTALTLCATVQGR